jgi:hypothetical protein
MIHTLDINFNIGEALEYHKILTQNYQHLHWWYEKDHNDPLMIDPKNDMDIVHGWGLQTIYNDLTFPYHCDLDPHNEGPEYFKDTELVFGFFKKFKDRFSLPYRSFLLTFPPSKYIGKWIPAKPPHGKIIAPLYTNEESKVISFRPEGEMSITLEAGKIYLLETEHYAEFRNDGSSDLTVITFNILTESFNQALELKGTI